MMESSWTQRIVDLTTEIEILKEYIYRLQVLILHHADFQGCRYYATDNDAWAAEVRAIKEMRKYKEGA